MARIVGVDLPREKQVVIGLTYIYGIGLTTSKKILNQTQIAHDKRVKDLTDQEVSAIAAILQSYKVEGDLKREVTQNIKRLMDIGCYRGMRHIKGLPVRGQRSKTNSRTRKGKKAGIGGRKK